MKKIIYLLILIPLCNHLFAQTDTIKLSVFQATQFGISNRFDVKSDSLNIDIAESKWIRAKKELLPDLSVSGKLTYYDNLQPSIIPAGYLGFTEPEKVSIGMKNNTAFALDLTYAIYKPGLYTDIKLAKNNLSLEKEKTNKNNIDVKIEISESYYNVLLKDLQYVIAQKNEQRYKEYYDLANGKFNNGALIESDALQSQLDYKNAKANTEKQKQNYMLSQQYLKYKINLPAQSVIILTDSLHSMENTKIMVDFSETLASNRSELKQLGIEQDANALQLKKARQNYLPSLSFFANYTQLFQGPEFNYSNNFYWAPVNYIGVKLTIPITGSIKNINSVKECKFRLSQTDFNLKQKTAEVEYEIQQAITKLSNTERNLFVAKDNYKLSQEVYELKKQQYSLGSFSYEKLLDTEKSLAATEQDYITAVYDFLIAKINYQKAIGDFK